jgi:hypothetical protein
MKNRKTETEYGVIEYDGPTGTFIAVHKSGVKLGHYMADSLARLALAEYVAPAPPTPESETAPEPEPEAPAETEGAEAETPTPESESADEAESTAKPRRRR